MGIRGPAGTCAQGNTAGVWAPYWCVAARHPPATSAREPGRRVHHSESGFISAVDLGGLQRGLRGDVLVATQLGGIESWRLPAVPKEAQLPFPELDFSCGRVSGRPWWGAAL